MYQQHFGLTEQPFSLTPNTHYFHSLQPHVEAMQVLQTALQEGEGFIKVTGEVGTGKTLLCRKLLNELPDHFVTAYLPNPYLDADEMRSALASELGLTGQHDRRQLTEAINQTLLTLSREGKQVVLLVDEAQALPTASLEALRLFSNLETESRKLLQVVLFGQPELDMRLTDEALRQLRQRITFSYCLRPLLQDEVAGYIDHRLLTSGYRGAPLFPEACIKLIWQASGGIPRLINILSHKALMLCFGKGVRQVTTAFVKAAIADSDALAPTRTTSGFGTQFSSLQVRCLLVLLVLETGLILGWLLEQWR